MKTLVIALELQLKLLEELHALLNREMSELSEIHVDAMLEINIKKENVATCIQTHSTVLRNEIVQAIKKEGLPPAATLGQLAERFSLKGIKDISRLHTELNKVAGQTKQMLQINSEIAEKFAASVSNSLALLTRVINQSNTYGASGGYQQRPTGAVLVNREA
ncbi:MAG: flagellar export chaperone FlgN [Desulfuromonadaceae bacterium]|nr:flagellar export chaperone FlgN [Desulfuromonadaceae bacterium]MDD5104068.1 flagellar export chaperone FlgN [Desulfuromonadaceae bacterium]